jgi:nitrogen fixation-related uncharacterized protein
MYPVLPVSLYCPFLCIQCCQFLCITHSYVSNVASFSVLSILVVLCLMYPMLPVSLYCPFLCIQCCQFLCIVHSYVSNVASFSVLSILIYPMLPVSLYCPFLCIQCCQFWQHWIHKNGQYRETGNTGYIRHKTTRMDNTEKLATLDT